MSFALGFVKGLVGGFTENIKKEQEARGMDDQRLAAIEDTMIQASLDPKKRVPESLATMVRDAKAGLKKRGGIDIFGRAGPRLELDINKISGLMNQVDDDDKPKFIEYGFQPNNMIKIPPTSQSFFDKSIDKDSLTLSDMWFKSHDKYFENQANIDAFMDFMNKEGNELSRNRFIADYTRYAVNYKNLTGKSFTSDGLPARKFPTLNENYITPDIVKSLIEAGPNETKIEIDSSINYMKKADSTFDFDKNTILIQDADETWRPYKFRDDEMGLTAVEKMTALKRLAKRFIKSGDVNEFVAMLRKQNQKGLVDFEGTGVQIDPKTKKVIVGSRFPVIEPDIFRPAYSDLFHAINLEHLGAYKSLVNDDLSAPYKYLKDNFFTENNDGTFSFKSRDAVRVLASVINVPESDLAQVRSERGIMVRQTDEFINDMFERTIGSNLKDFTERWNATKRTMSALNTLKDLKGETDLPSSGFIPAIAKIYGNIVIPTGVIDQIGNFISGRGKLKKGTTQKSLQDIIRDSGLAKDVDNLTKQEALMIALAADMARAVDPSGRLSNQDFEVQLRRLGQTGFFSSKISESAALSTVIDDFKKRYDHLEMISLVTAENSGGGKNLTERELQILYANKKFFAMKEVNTQGGDEPPPKLNLQSTYVNDENETQPRFLIITGVNLGPVFPPNNPLAQKYPNGRPLRAYDRKTGAEYNIIYDNNDNMSLGTIVEEDNI